MRLAETIFSPVVMADRVRRAVGKMGSGVVNWWGVPWRLLRAGGEDCKAYYEACPCVLVFGLQYLRMPPEERVSGSTWCIVLGRGAYPPRS